MIRSRHKKRPHSKVWDEPSCAKASEGRPLKPRPGESPSQFASRKDRMEQRLANLRHEREVMPVAEIERRIVALLIECAKACRAVTEADIRGLNVPMKAVTPAMKQRCTQKARAEFPEFDNRMMAAA